MAGPTPSPTSGGLPVFDPGSTGAAPSTQGKTKAQTPANAVGSNDVAGGSAPMVFWGTTPTNKPKGPYVGKPPDDIVGKAFAQLGVGQEQTKTLQEAVNAWYTMSDADQQAFAQKAYRLGLISDPHNFQQAFGQWQETVRLASNYYMAANKKVTPWQALDILGGSTMGGAGAGGPKTQTGTSTSVHVPTVEDAHVLTKQLFQSLMGRDPTGAELDQYASMVTAYARKHPDKTTTTTTTDGKGNSTSTSSSSGGVSEAAMQDTLAEQAKADPEYGAYQAATTYYNALLQAIGGGSGG